MPTPNGPLLEFFSQFNFIEYTYDPHNPPLEEFKRLCQARRWGASKIRKHETVFLFAVEGEKDLRGGPAGPNVTKFFRKYEYRLFTYDLDAPPQSEFQRLVGLRGWGERNLSKVTKRFKKAVALDAREQSVHDASEPTAPEDPGIQEAGPLPDWLRRQECRGYKYLGGLPELEFKKLVNAKKKEWKRIYGEQEGPWGCSTEAESLRAEWYKIVEHDFDSMLDGFCLITGITPWQVFVGLYGGGRVEVTREAARTVRSTKDPVARLQDPLTHISDS